MKPAVALAALVAVLAFAASDSFAQVYVAPAPTVVYRPTIPTFPAYVDSQVVVNRPVIAAPTVVNYAPTVSAPAVSAPTVVNYAPAVSSPTVVNYAPTVPSPTVVNYAPAASTPTVVNYAPAATSAPVVAASPVVAPAPIVAYRPAPVITYRAPLRYVPPTVVGYPGNVSTVYANPVVAAPDVVVRPKVYYRGQPVRNVLRAITP